MGFHPLRDDCACFRCVWRVHFAHWWEALPTKGAARTCAASACSIMSNASTVTPSPSHSQSPTSVGNASAFVDSLFQVDADGAHGSGASSPIMSRRHPTLIELEEEIEDSALPQRKRARSTNSPSSRIVVPESAPALALRVPDSLAADTGPHGQQSSQPVFTQDLGHVQHGTSSPLTCHCMLMRMRVTAPSFESRWHSDSALLLGACIS